MAVLLLRGGGPWRKGGMGEEGEAEAGGRWQENAAAWEPGAWPLLRASPPWGPRLPWFRVALSWVSTGALTFPGKAQSWGAGAAL